MLEKLLSGNMMKLNLAELIVLILNFPDEINTLMIQKTLDGYCVVVDDISVQKEQEKSKKNRVLRGDNIRGLNDNSGAEIGMRLTCQRCGEHVFRKQTGYNSVDAAIKNRHSFYDEFEPVPDGWEIKHDLGGWCCPECIEKYNQVLENFKKETKW